MLFHFPMVFISLCMNFKVILYTFLFKFLQSCWRHSNCLNMCNEVLFLPVHCILLCSNFYGHVDVTIFVCACQVVLFSFVHCILFSSNFRNYVIIAISVCTCAVCTFLDDILQNNQKSMHSTLCWHQQFEEKSIQCTNVKSTHFTRANKYCDITITIEI